jgi:hypothetical protein
MIEVLATITRKPFEKRTEWSHNRDRGFESQATHNAAAPEDSIFFLVGCGRFSFPNFSYLQRDNKNIHTYLLFETCASCGYAVRQFFR